jgi:hypothetical protein
MKYGALKYFSGKSLSLLTVGSLELLENTKDKLLGRLLPSVWLE